MSDEAERLSEQKAREEREADLFVPRIIQLHLDPIKGNFDTDHLKTVHAYIFQDLPHHRPGITRDDTAESWIKHRALEGRPVVYDVPYVSQGVEARITDILGQFGGVDSLKGLTLDTAAGRLAGLYGDLDHAHGFYEGNSRTLREFTRELASEAGFTLDWVKTAIGAKERNELYVARDLAVLERAYPDLTSEKAMQTNDRAEYETFFVIEGLRRMVGDKSLIAIIREGLERGGIEQQTQQTQSQAAGTSTGSGRVAEFLKGEQIDREAERAAMQELSKSVGSEVAADKPQDRGRGGSHSR